MYYKKNRIPEHLRERFDHFMELKELHATQINSILAIFLLSTSIVMGFCALPYQLSSKKLEILFNKIHKNISSPLKVKDIELSIKLSIGASAYPIDGDNYDDLMKIADTKMYKEKSSRSKSRNTALIEAAL